MDAPSLSGALFLITDPTAPYERMLETVRAAVRGGVTHVVLRRPHDTAAALCRACEALLADRAPDASWRLLVHDRVDVALAVKADGVHLPGHGLPIEAARRLVGERLLGVSVHSPQQAVMAAAQGADYVMFGHVYATPSHPGEPGRGVAALQEVAAAVGIPVVAIGGITAENVGDVVAAGASGVAVIRAISEAADPESAARTLREALDRAFGPSSTPRKEPG